MENGRAVYNIVQELKTAPRDVLEEVIRNVAGSALSEEGLQAWKGDGQVSRLLVHLCALHRFSFAIICFLISSAEPDMLLIPAASFQQSNSMSDRNHITEHSTVRYYHLLLVVYYLICNWGLYLR